MTVVMVSQLISSHNFTRYKFNKNDTLNKHIPRGRRIYISPWHDLCTDSGDERSQPLAPFTHRRDSMKLAFTLSAYIALFLYASLDASAQRRPRRGPPPPPRAPAPERAPARPPTVETPPESPLGDTLDPRRSLMVTDALITDRF